MDGVGTRARLRVSGPDAGQKVDREYDKNAVAQRAGQRCTRRRLAARRADNPADRGRAPRRAWRPRLRPSGSHGCQGARATGALYLARAAAPAAQSRSDPLRSRAFSAICRRLPASTPRSTAVIAPSWTTTRSPTRFYAEGVRRYGFHGLSYEYICGPASSSGSRDRIRPRDCCSPGQRRLHVRACPADAASRARWASPRSTDCPWAPGRGRSIRASCFI